MSNNVIKLNTTDCVCMYMYQTEYIVTVEDIQDCLSTGFTFLPKLVKAENTIYSKIPSRVDKDGYVI